MYYKIAFGSLTLFKFLKLANCKASSFPTRKVKHKQEK